MNESSEMEELFVRLASGNLAAMSALVSLMKEFGKDTMLYTLVPAIKKRGLTGKAFGYFFAYECGADAMVCGVALCPLLCVHKARKGCVSSSDFYTENI